MTKDRKAKRTARDRQDMSGGPYSAARRSAAWPPEMVLSIDTPHHITQLLYIRAAWGLRTATEPPPLDPQPEAGASAAPSSASPEEWARRWDAQWALAWDWYRIERRHAEEPRELTSERLRELVGDGSGLNPVVPPMWSFRYGDHGIDHEAYSTWKWSFTRLPRGPLEEQPVRRSVHAVTAAWRTGLEEVIVLPHAGHHAERVTTRHLVVSDTTWQTTVLREQALALPAPDADGTGTGTGTGTDAPRSREDGMMTRGNVLPEDAPDPRRDTIHRLRATPVPVLGLVPQPHLEDWGCFGFEGGAQDGVTVRMAASLGYTLWRNPDDRDDPVNLAELDDATRRALEVRPRWPRPSWLVAQVERMRYPMLWEAVRTTWDSSAAGRPTAEEELTRHVDHILRNRHGVQWTRHPWERHVDPDRIEHGVPIIVNGTEVPGMRIDADPRVLALGADLGSDGVLTAVVDRKALPYLTLEFATRPLDEASPAG